MSDRLAHMSDGAFSLVAAHFYILVSIKAALYTLVCQFSSADHSFSFSSLTTYTESVVSVVITFLRCLDKFVNFLGYFHKSRNVWKRNFGRTYAPS